jgi:hypothetical protein
MEFIMAIKILPFSFDKPLPYVLLWSSVITSVSLAIVLLFVSLS